MISLLYNKYIQLTYIRILMFIRKKIFFFFHPMWKTYYNIVENKDMSLSKSSDTIFIFGSGYSLNDISKEEFRDFEKHDTLAFNWFVYQNFLKIKYQLIREVCINEKDIYELNEKMELYKMLINRDIYKDTIFMLQNDLTATMPFEMLSRFIFPKFQNLYFFKTFSRKKKAFPNQNLTKGLVHSAGTLTDCVSFAYAMGYSKIVLVGVDLYDKRYFWLQKDETNPDDLKENINFTYRDKHKTADPMLKVIAEWQKNFQKEGIQIYVYNERSLLSEFLPTYKITKDK